MPGQARQVEKTHQKKKKKQDSAHAKPRLKTHNNIHQQHLQATSNIYKVQNTFHVEEKHPLGISTSCSGITVQSPNRSYGGSDGNPGGRRGASVRQEQSQTVERTLPAHPAAAPHRATRPSLVHVKSRLQPLTLLARWQKGHKLEER